MCNLNDLTDAGTTRSYSL